MKMTKRHLFYLTWVSLLPESDIYDSMFRREGAQLEAEGYLTAFHSLTPKGKKLLAGAVAGLKITHTDLFGDTK